MIAISRKGQYNNEGNSVANYSWQHCKCTACNGEGLVKACQEDVMQYLICLRYGLKSYSIKQLREVIREWRHNDRCLPCEKCDGLGEWEKLT